MFFVEYGIWAGSAKHNYTYISFQWWNGNIVWHDKGMLYHQMFSEIWSMEAWATVLFYALWNMEQSLQRTSNFHKFWNDMIWKGNAVSSYVIWNMVPQRSEQPYFSFAFWTGNVVWHIMKRECCIIMYDMKYGAVCAKHIQLSWIVKWHNMERECCIIIGNMKYGATEVWAIVMDVCTARTKKAMENPPDNQTLILCESVTLTQYDLKGNYFLPTKILWNYFAFHSRKKSQLINHVSDRHSLYNQCA